MREGPDVGIASQDGSRQALGPSPATSGSAQAATEQALATRGAASANITKLRAEREAALISHTAVMG